MKQRFHGLLEKFKELSKATRAIIAVLVVAVVAIAVVFMSRGDSQDSVFVPRGDTEEVLAVDDPQGSPHFALPSDFDPSVNTDAEVPAELRKDADGALTVKSASFIAGEGPYVLDWRMKNGDSDISCLNCAMLDARLKNIIAAVLSSGSAEGIERIVGVEPARTLAGDYSGNGWQVEFVVGTSAKARKAGEQISAWLLENSVENKVLSVMWQNLLYSHSECGTKLLEVAPVEAYPIAIPANPSAQRDAAMDRVVVASPSYIPQFEDRDGAQFVTGWKASSC
jgi:hypothetical protein